MKLLVVILAFMTGNALALPVLNENASLTGGDSVIWPDSHDPHTFYYAPKSLKTVDQYQWGFYLRKNTLHVGFIPEIDAKSLELNRLAIEKKFQGKRVRLLLLEFIEDKAEIGKVFEDFTESQECRYNSEVGSAYLFYCRLTLSLVGEELLLPLLVRKKQIALTSVFRVKGNLRRIDGSLNPYEMKFGLPVILEKPNFSDP